MHFAFEGLHFAMTAAPCDRAQTNLRRAGRERPCARSSSSMRAHGDAEILGRSRPARRIDARRAIQRVDAQTGIIGQRGMAAAVGGGVRLQFGIGGERRVRFLPARAGPDRPR